MEKKPDVVLEIGEPNFAILMEEIRAGRIKREIVKQLSMLMHPHVHGVFVEKNSQIDLDLSTVMKYMLDTWFEKELFKQDIAG